MKYKTGISLALLTAVISGFSIFYNKLVVVKGIDSTIFNIIKNGGVGLILTALLVSSGRVAQLPKLSRKHWIRLILIGALGGSIPFVLFFEGLKTASAIDATLIQKTMFLWVAGLAVPFLGEKIRWQHLAAFLLIAWSNVFIGGFKGFTGNTPELMIIAATLLWSVEIIITKKVLATVDTIIVSWARMTLGAGFLLILAALQGKIGLLALITPQQVVLTIGSILFLTAYVTSWHAALKRAPATLVTCTLILATPITNILSAVFLTHTFPPAQIINVVGSLIGVGILLIADLYANRKAHPTIQST